MECILTHSYKQARAHAHTRACIHTCTYVRTHTHAHVNRHLDTHKHKKAHTHTHTRMCVACSSNKQEVDPTLLSAQIAYYILKAITKAAAVAVAPAETLWGGYWRS